MNGFEIADDLCAAAKGLRRRCYDEKVLYIADFYLFSISPIRLEEMGDDELQQMLEDAERFGQDFQAESIQDPDAKPKDK